MGFAVGGFFMPKMLAHHDTLADGLAVDQHGKFIPGQGFTMVQGHLMEWR